MDLRDVAGAPDGVAPWARAASALGLGLEVGSVRLAEHDPRWSTLAGGLVGVLGSWLPSSVLAVQHVGSTAVADMLAKPILDVALALAPATEVESVVVDALVEAGCIDRGSVDDDGEDRMLAIEAEPSVRVAHLHLVAVDGAAWRDLLAFRDALRRSPTTRRRYEDEKLRLVAAGVPRDAYRRTKADVIAHILAQRVTCPPAP